MIDDMSVRASNSVFHSSPLRPFSLSRSGQGVFLFSIFSTGEVA